MFSTGITRETDLEGRERGRRRRRRTKEEQGRKKKLPMFETSSSLDAIIILSKHTLLVCVER